MTRKPNNLRLAFVLVAVGLGMLGVAYAFVPLYKVFCQVMGIPLPSVAVSAELARPKDIAGPTDRVITVRFMGQNNATMPVRLAPTTYTMKVRIGQPTLTAYKATNPTQQGLDGVAVHTLLALGGMDGVNIANHIDLQQCFCFEEQHYPGNQTVNLPLSFTIAPTLPPDVHTITFSYTLFPADQYHRLNPKKG